MEQFRIIYRILKILAQSMNDEEFDRGRLGAEALGVSEPMRAQLLKMVAREGLAEGVRVIEHDGEGPPEVRITGRPCITLKGLEYLEENSLMRRAAEMAKGIREIIG